MVVADNNLGVEPGAPAGPVAPKLRLRDLGECELDLFWLFVPPDNNVTLEFRRKNVFNCNFKLYVNFI